MKIKISKDLYVNSNTLLRIEWRKYYPVLVIHEKFEKILKWVLRVIAFVGIGASAITLKHWYDSLGLSILIFLVEQFFEKAAIEYTTMVFQEPPDFEIDYGQWKTNGFMIPREQNSKDLAHFGPTYSDEEYAINFFKYLLSWINNSSKDDRENNLVISLVIEPDEKYTTYIYANPRRKRLDYMFKFLSEQSKLTKYGKRQQQFVAQMLFWHTLDFKDGFYIKRFLDFQKANQPFFFTPSVLQPFGLPPKFLFDCSIKKYELKIRKRSELNKKDTEFHHRTNDKEIADEPTHKIKKGIWHEIEKVLSKSVDMGFIPNQGSEVGAINLCYSDIDLPFLAYKRLIIEKAKGELEVIIKQHGKYVDLAINIPLQNVTLLLQDQNFNKVELNLFKSTQRDSHVLLLIGYPPASERHVILGEETSPLIVKWKFEEFTT